MFLTILVTGLAEPSLADSVRFCSAAVHSAQLEDAMYACSRQAEEDTACGAVLGLGRTAPFALPMLPAEKRAAALAYFDARVAACIEHEEGL